MAETAIKIGLIAAIAVVLFLTFRRRGRPGLQFLPDGALVTGDASVGQRLELELPPGPALDVMLRYSIDHNEPVINPGTSNRRNGFAVLVEASRAAAGDAPATSRRFERVFGGAETLGLAPVEEGGPTYQVRRMYGRETGTKLLLSLPPGGSGTLAVLVDNSLTDVGALTVFVKPASS